MSAPLESHAPAAAPGRQLTIRCESAEALMRSLTLFRAEPGVESVRVDRAARVLHVRLASRGGCSFETLLAG